MLNGLHLTDTGFKLILSYKACFTKRLNAAIFKSELYSDIMPYNVENVLKYNTVKLDPDFITVYYFISTLYLFSFFCSKVQSGLVLIIGLPSVKLVFLLLGFVAFLYKQ